MCEQFRWEITGDNPGPGWQLNRKPRGGDGCGQGGRGRCSRNRTDGDRPGGGVGGRGREPAQAVRAGGASAPLPWARVSSPSWPRLPFMDSAGDSGAGVGQGRASGVVGVRSPAPESAWVGSDSPGGGRPRVRPRVGGPRSECGDGRLWRSLWSQSFFSFPFPGGGPTPQAGSAWPL